ncbi:MAG TPA: MFS transporter [Nocardioides sp.]|uniref:MFS transporter n=1 Tax=Nocardioides sp. TaxID=35761 RepID=UPI002F41F95C
MNVRLADMHGKPTSRRTHLSRTLAQVLAGWRTGLSGPVIVLQAGTAVNYFGTGLVLPFEIIYLHQARGFPTATAGLVLAAVMGTAAVLTPFSGALLDRFRAKPILIIGNLASALGYAGFAFVGRPWQAFVCAAVGGAGFGVANTANQVLSLTLVSAEQRASSIALRRVAGNFGLGSGATVAGFIVASANDLRTFQALYLFDGATFAVFALVVIVGIPNPRLAKGASASDGGTGFRAVARDRLFLILIAANIVLVMTGGALFSNILAPFAKAYTPVGRGEIGVVIFINTFFIVVAQIPATRVVKRMGRTHALAATSTLFATGLLAVLLATLTSSTLTATTVLAGVAIVIAVGECAQFIVLGPLIAELAPPHLLGRYMSLYGLTFTAGVALGPAVGGALLATSPDAVWWGGALAAALIGAGLLRLGDRIPDPLVQAPWPPPRVVRGADLDSARRSQTSGTEMERRTRT